MENFLFGLIFAIVLLPLFDGLTTLILSFFEMIKSFFARVINHNNNKINGLEDNIVKNKIGFSIEEEVEEDDL